MIKIINATEEHVPLLKRMARIGRLSEWPKSLYKLVLLLALGYGMIILYKDKPAGFLFAIPILGAVFVHQVAILPKYRRKGLGSKLLDKVHDDHDTVYLIPVDKAKPWYEKKGYRSLVGRLWWRERSSGKHNSAPY